MTQYGEPWRLIVAKSRNLMLFSDQELPGVFIAMTCVKPTEIQRKKMERIVACVNACANLSDESLDSVIRGQFRLILQ